MQTYRIEGTTQCLPRNRSKTYHDDGYLIVKSLFDAEEIELLRRTAVADRQMNQKSFGRADGEGGTVRLTLWNHPGNGIYGMYARCNRIVNAMEQLLGGEVYHYHSKMILKDPEVGGAWAWHQDYGYWYDNYVLYPLMSSVSIAVDPATRENGCMQVLNGSHHLGRITHVETGQQAGADLERVVPKPKSASSWSTARRSRATRFSSTATSCTAPTRTARTIRAGH